MSDILKTRVLIAGAGAVDGCTAARLIEKGIDTTLMTRPERFEQIVVHGLRVTSPFGRFRKPVRGVVSAQLSKSYDLVIFACRAHLLPDAIQQAADAVGPNTFVLSLTGGGPNMEHLRRRYPADKSMGGIFEGRVRIDADGIIGHRPPEARILIGERSRGDRVAARIAELLTGRGLDAKTTSELDRWAWARSIFLGAGVGTSIMTKRPLTDALRFHPGQTHFAYMVGEGCAIAAANGVEIDKATMWRYRHSLTLVGEPLMSPPLVSDPGGSSQEAFYLMTQLIRRPGGGAASGLRLALSSLADEKAGAVIDA